MSEFDTEPVRGLPEVLPPGERMLWQGQPSWRALAIQAFHVRKVALYFGVLVAWRLATDVIAGTPALQAATSVLWLMTLGLCTAGMLCLLAWLYGRTTVFTITNRRVVMRYGVALPWTLNLPYRIVQTAALRLRSDGTADIPLTLTGNGRVSYVHLWPFARPWHINHPQPMLRALPDGEKVAQIVANALKSYSETLPGGAIAVAVSKPIVTDAIATPAAAAA